MSNHGERHHPQHHHHHHQPVTTNQTNSSVTLVSSSHAQNEIHSTASLVSGLQHVPSHHSQSNPHQHSHQQHQQRQQQQQHQHNSQIQPQHSPTTMPAGVQQTAAAIAAATSAAAAASIASQSTPPPPHSVGSSTSVSGQSASGQQGGNDDFVLHHLEDGFTDLNLSSTEFPVNIKLENAFSPFIIESEVSPEQHCVSAGPLPPAPQQASSLNYNTFGNSMPNLIAHSVDSTHQQQAQQQQHHHSSNNLPPNNAQQVSAPIYTAIIDNKDNKQFHPEGVPFTHFSTPPNAEQLLYQSYLYNSRSIEDEESFDSDDTFSDESSIRHKPMLSDVMLQTVPENFVQPDMNTLKNSKKICFDGIERDSRSQNGMNFSPNPQNAQYPNLTLVQQAANLAITSPGALLNQFDTAAIQNPLNVPNSYGYSYRRWSNRDAPTVKNTKSGSIQLPHTIPNMIESDRDFQYLLGAPTAAGTKHGEMTMTYLNQGQSYEIRLKRIQKTNDLNNMKTTIRLGFYEKRLLYKETEEIANWNVLNPKDRPLEIDIAMSYGVFNINPISEFNNIIQFEWNPGREASIFIKINCISTAFTFKRHGGERGSPFRLIIETTSITDNRTLDKASCLIKVFKSKGAERKHKTDRDRIAKHPDADKLFRPSTDCTVFTTYEEEPLLPPKAEKGELTVTTCLNPGSGSQMMDSSGNVCGSGSSSSIGPGAESPISTNPSGQIYNRYSDTPGMGETSPTLSQCHHSKNSNTSTARVPDLSGVSISSPLSNSDPSSTLTPGAPATPTCLQLPQSTSQSEELLNNNSSVGVPFDGSSSSCSIPFPVNATAVDTYHWLRKHRFFQLAERLCEYTADDLKRLSKNDLLDLCDRKDGIRLYNLIHLPEGATTKLKIFITFDGEEYFALYLKSWSVKEFKEKLMECLAQHDNNVRIRNMHTIIRGGRKVRVTDSDVENIHNETIFCCKLLKLDDEEFDVQLSEMENTCIDS